MLVAALEGWTRDTDCIHNDFATTFVDGVGFLHRLKRVTLCENVFTSNRNINKLWPSKRETLMIVQQCKNQVFIIYRNQGKPVYRTQRAVSIWFTMT